MADINLDDYKSNSNSKKSEESADQPKINPVITRTEEVRKSGPLNFFRRIFNNNPETKVSIVSNVVIPEIKKMLDDSFHMMLFPNGGNNRSERNKASKISYRSYYDRDDFPREEDFSEEQRSIIFNVYDYDRVPFDTRGEAESVIKSMWEVLDRYKIITVANYYELSDIKHYSYPCNDYGWTDIRSAEAIPYGRRWRIKISRPMPIN